MSMSPALRRRTLLLGAAGAGAVSLGSLTAPKASAAVTDPATRKVLLVGANPGVQLFDGDTCTAYASCWRVDWSPYGAGTALGIWYDAQVHLVGSDERLARWLESHFTRYFPEVEGLTWPAPIYHLARVDVDIDLATGLRAHGAGFAVRTDTVLDRRTFVTDDFPLGDVVHSLSLVFAPCAHGSIVARGHTLPGEIATAGTPARPWTSAFLSEAEVWKA